MPTDMKKAALLAALSALVFQDANPGCRFLRQRVNYVPESRWAQI